MTIPRLKLGGFGFYIIVGLISILVWQTQSYMTSLSERRLRQQAQGGVVGSSPTQLDSVQERQLDAYLELDRLLTTFGTTLLGALGFLLFGWQRAGSWTQHRWASYLGVLCVATSIFFGYVAYLFVLWMLRNTADPDFTSLSPHWAQQAQFYTFLAGVLFLADFVFYNLNQEVAREKPQSVTGP